MEGKSPALDAIATKASSANIRPFLMAASATEKLLRYFADLILQAIQTVGLDEELRCQNKGSESQEAEEGSWYSLRR